GAGRAGDADEGKSGHVFFGANWVLVFADGYPYLRPVKASFPPIPVVLSLLVSLFLAPLAAEEKPIERDIVIYGGTCAAVIAAVRATQGGKSVVVVSPDTHLGGLSSGGLGWTDTGNKAVIGGLSRDFYHRVWKQYQKPENWKWQRQQDYSGKGQGTPAMDGDRKTMWIFEPGIAEAVFEEYVEEFDLEVHRDEWLDREKGVVVQEG